MNPKFSIRTFTFFTQLCLVCQISFAQETKLLPADGSAGDKFGQSVSVSGDYIAVGAYEDQDNGFLSGSAYVFKRSGTNWIEETKIIASDGLPGDWFGYSVSLSDDYLLIGAWGYFNAKGKAYIFKRTGSAWAEEAILAASDGAGSDWFGFGVSISGDYAVIGSRWDDDKGEDSGSVYIYKNSGTTWSEEIKLTASDGKADDWFGYSVFISGDYLIAGALGDGNFRGAAYIFKNTGTNWVEEAKLIPSDGMASDQFGHSVYLSGNYAMVGALDSEAVYVFKNTGGSWEQESKVIPMVSAGGFGFGVSAPEDLILTGAPFDNQNGQNSGAAFIFKKTGSSWTEKVKLLPMDGTGSHEFGHSVSVSENFAVVGALGHNANGANSGAVYVFDLNELVPADHISSDKEFFNIYPNPTKRFLTISSGVNQKIENIVLYDQSGRKIFQTQSENQTLDLSSVSPGLYFLVAEFGDGKRVKKLVVE